MLSDNLKAQLKTQEMNKLMQTGEGSKDLHGGGQEIESAEIQQGQK